MLRLGLSDGSPCLFDGNFEDFINADLKWGWLLVTTNDLHEEDRVPFRINYNEVIKIKEVD